MDKELVEHKIDEACRTAEEFTQVYYDNLDKRRHLISKFYMDSAVMVWNGNGFEGKDQISKFFTELPPTEHIIATLDSQPIIGPTDTDQASLLVKISGRVSYGDKNHRPFNQNFLITAIDDKWKIVNDCFRLQEVIM